MLMQNDCYTCASTELDIKYSESQLGNKANWKVTFPKWGENSRRAHTFGEFE